MFKCMCLDCGGVTEECSNLCAKVRNIGYRRECGTCYLRFECLVFLDSNRYGRGNKRELGDTSWMRKL